MLTGLKLLATALLGASYIVLAFVAAHPRVTPEYAAHFLHRTSDCWLPQGLRDGVPPPATVQTDQLGYPEACRYLRLNWRRAEGWGTRAGASQATLRLPWLPDAQAVELTLRGAPEQRAPVRVRLFLDGQVTTAEIPAGSTKTVALPLLPTPDHQAHEVQLGLSHGAPGSDAASPWAAEGVGLVTIRYLLDAPVDLGQPNGPVTGG